MTASSIEELRTQIKQILTDVPVNTTCPYCEGEIDPSHIICIDSKFDKDEWDKIANRLIAVVASFVSNNIIKPKM